jgi:tetratricopeptide (TPR) repeat protein
MIMPYGVKPTQQREGSKAPASVNFDRLWDAAIRPAIVDLQYDPVRADQDLGALIIKEMIERLAISDLVVADLSIPNGNVYYEVGIRHAAKQQGCVLISADWAQPLFDVAQMRQIRYPLPGAEVDAATAAAIKAALKAGIPGLADGLSPFYDTLPGFPDRFDPSRATSFKDALKELSAFQAAVTAARLSPPPLCGELALTLSAQYAGGPMQHIVALDLLYLLRDCTDWPTTLAYIEKLPPALQELPVVIEQTALAQSKAGNHQQAIGALLQLIALNGETSERRGLIGGRYKQLYYSTADEVLKATYLDQAIREYDTGMHVDLNDYFPSSNLPRLYRTRNGPGDDRLADVAAAVSRTACERAQKQTGTDIWLTATLLGAAFDDGTLPEAQRLARELRLQGLAPWQLKTMLPDLELSIALQSESDGAALRTIVADLGRLVTRASAAPAGVGPSSA